MARNPSNADTRSTAPTDDRRKHAVRALHGPGTAQRTPWGGNARLEQPSSAETTTEPGGQAAPPPARFPARLRPLPRYLLALLLVVAATLVRGVIGDVLSPTPFLVFYLAWVAAAAIGGLGPGLLATVASWLCVTLFFEPPFGRIGFGDPASVDRLVVFLVGGLAVSLMGEKIRRVRLRERRRTRELAAANAALRESEAGLAAAQRLAHIGSWQWNIAEDTARWSDETFRIFGIARGPLQEHRAGFVSRVVPEDRQRVDQALSDALHGVKDYDLDYRIRGPEGRERVIHAQAQVLRADDGRPVMMHGTVQDITERQRAEEALRESEEKHRRIVETATEGIVMVDAEARIVFVNDRGLKFLGYSREEAGQMTLFDLVFPEDLAATKQRWESRKQGRKERYEFRLRRKDGSTVWALISMTPRFGPTGEFLGELVMAVDITQRRQAEEALRRSEARLNRSQEIAHLGSWELDLATHELSWSDEVYRIFGLAPQEFGATYEAFLERVHPEDQQAVDEAYTGSIREGRDTYEIEHRIIRKDTGEVRTVHEKCEHFRDARGKIVRSVGMVHDITERKRAEEALAESRKKYRGLVEKINDWVWEVDAECVYSYSSPRALELLGYAPEEIVGKTPFDLMPSGERERVRHVFQPIWQERKPFVLLENTLLCRDGRLVTVETSGVPLFAEDGSFRGYTGVDRDVTSRKQAEASLQRAKSFTDRLLNAPFDTVFVFEPVTGTPVRWNTRFTDVSGYDDEEIAGMKAPDDFYDEDDLRKARECIGRILAAGQCVVELFLITKQGVRIPFEYATTVVEDEEGKTLLLSVGRDITERRRAEEALREWTATLESRVAERTAELEQRARQLQKLTLELSEAEERERGRVAAILHDDLQQVLAAAKFQVGLLRGGARGPDQAQEILGHVSEMLKSAIEKSRHLSHELSPAVLRQGDLVEAFDWLAEQMQTKHGLTVRVEASGAVVARSEAVKTLVYRSAQEMLFNVVKHAQVGEARLRIRRRGRYLCLSVSDRGCGFDPQEISKTAGLGLRTIRERVALLGGRMKIRSARGRGTSFRLVVPDAEPSPNDAAPERESSSLPNMQNTLE